MECEEGEEGEDGEDGGGGNGVIILPGLLLENASSAASSSLFGVLGAPLSTTSAAALLAAP